MKLLLDSVILIDHLNGVSQATVFLADNHADAAISVITRAEVLAGVGSPEITRVRIFLDAFMTLAIDRDAADSAAVLRQEFGWKLPDAFQAALAKQHGLRLVTRNSRDFPAKRHDFVVIPYKL